MKHNHLTRDIKAPGRCPKCDEWWGPQVVEWFSDVFTTVILPPQSVIDWLHPKTEEE